MAISPEIAGDREISTVSSEDVLILKDELTKLTDFNRKLSSEGWSARNMSSRAHWNNLLSVEATMHDRNEREKETS